MDKMKEIRIEKITLNIGAGKDQEKLEKALSLLKQIGDMTPIKTTTKKRIQEWGLRPGLPIGCKVTLRKSKINALLPRLFSAIDNSLTEDQFDNTGNLSFGIPEYIDIPGAKYDPKIGIMGLDVAITLIRPGYRIKKRRINPRPIPLNHRITKNEAIGFIVKNFDIKINSDLS